MTTTKTDRVSVYQIITEKIIDIMESGHIPWEVPYSSEGASMFPRNLVSNKEYRGINRWLLIGRFPSPYYLTLKQVLSLGARVKREEFRNYSIVTFWNIIEQRDAQTGEVSKRAFLRYYRVYNASQCEGLKHARLVEKKATKSKKNGTIAKAAEVIENMPNRPSIAYDSPTCAYYVPARDEVHIGKLKDFKSSEAHYSTFFHELVHSTGHGSRLDRELTNIKEKYSREELIAEFGAAFLCGLTGIAKPTIKNSAAYIQHWIQFLKSDEKAVVTCASKAEKAADYILGNLPEEEETEAED